MRTLALFAVLVGCAESPAAPSFELRVSFDRRDGTVIVNGAATTGPLVFEAATYAEAQTEIVLDVSVATATGMITTQLRPGYCAANPIVDLHRIGTLVLEGVGYSVVESSPPHLAVSSYVCEGTNGGAAGGP